MHAVGQVAGGHVQQERGPLPGRRDGGRPLERVSSEDDPGVVQGIDQVAPAGGLRLAETLDLCVEQPTPRPAEAIGSERLLELLSKVKLRAEFINGDDDANGRKRALARLASGEINVLIGTNILDVGVDVSSVGCIILGGGGKAEVANRQRIGRGLRAKKFGPNICFVLDFMDEYNQHLQGHAIQRREIIVSTPGFAENLLPMDTDWRIDDLGFKKIA